MSIFTKDRFRRIRGNSSRLLDLTCAHCGTHFCYYQKDGVGILKRLYVDRFTDIAPEGKELRCTACSKVLAVRFTYKPEERQAYRPFSGALRKHIVSHNKLSQSDD